MKPPPTRIYPDISDILARKAEGRRELAKLSFGQKVDILEAMRARVEPFRKAREARKRSQLQQKDPPASK
jgi:hypothetical protein